MKRYDCTAEEYALKDRENPQANLDIKIIKLFMVKGVDFQKEARYCFRFRCGAGRYFSFLKGETIVGVDLSIEMLKEAKKYRR